MFVGVSRMTVPIDWTLVNVGCRVLGPLSLGSMFAELDLTVDLAQIIWVVVRGTGAAATSRLDWLVLRASSEEIPQDETEHGDQNDDECPGWFGQDSDQTPVAQKAIEESV